MDGGHGHNEPCFLHEMHLYNLDRMNHQTLKMSIGVFSATSLVLLSPFMLSSFSRRRPHQDN